jgi:uncharacterized protein YcaQ
MDAKAWRKEGRLQVVSLYLEPGVRVSAGVTRALSKTLREYASWQGLSKVEIDWADSESLLTVVRTQLEKE